MISQRRSYSLVRRRRLCPSCGFEWPSLTFFYPGLSTKCPHCGKPVDGGSIARKGEAGS